MNKKIAYHKHVDKYTELLNQFFNYITVYKSEKLGKFPKEANIVIFDEKDSELYTYSNHILKKMMESNTPNIVEVRKTGIKELLWKVSTPLKSYCSVMRGIGHFCKSSHVA